MQKGRLGRFSEHAGCNASERRAGLEKLDAESAPPLFRGRLPPTGNASWIGDERTTGRLRRGIGGGMCARRAQEQHGKTCRWRSRANRELARASLGRQGGGVDRSTEEAE